MTEFLLGIDGGGSGCRAIVADKHGTPLGSAAGGPANIMTDFDSARENLAQVANSALQNAGLSTVEPGNISAVIGVAGANVGDYREQLTSQLPFFRSQVVNDSTIAVRGALGKDDGIVAAIGTGSIFVIQQAGNIQTIGGWGNVVGDQASGVWLGKRLLHDLLLCYDGVYPKSAFYKDSMVRFGNSAESIVAFAKDATPGDFSVFAKSIMDAAAANDSIALRIVQSAVADIELILQKTTDRHLQLCLTGSLGVRYADYLSDQFKARLQEAKGDAASGAIAMAVEHNLLRK